MIDSVATLINESNKLTFEEKMQIVNSAGNGRQEHERRYEREFAARFQQMLDEELIKNWYPVKASSKLDQEQVDFVIISNDNEILPLQVTSKTALATQRRQKIRKRFGLGQDEKILPIGVIYLIDRDTNEVKNFNMTCTDVLESFAKSETMKFGSVT